MAQWVKALAKTARTHMVEGDYRKLSSYLHMSEVLYTK